MRRAALVVFAAGVLGWTWALVSPNPVPPAVRDLLGFWDHAAFYAAKALHATVYAGLTAVGGYALGPRWPAVAVAMALHGAATEAAQTVVPNRHGSVRDVAIDAAGVAAGAALVRRSRR